MNEKKGCLAVVPFGNPPRAALEAVAENIRTRLGLSTEILPPLEVPSYAFDERRAQYNVFPLFNALEKKDFRYTKVIAVLNVDLFIPIFTHVFGEAQEGGKYAMVSLYRLRRNADGSNTSAGLLLERLAKVALHELGHLFDIVHCMNEQCVMHFSGTVEELDIATPHLCEYCWEYLKESFRHHDLSPVDWDIS